MHFYNVMILPESFSVMIWKCKRLCIYDNKGVPESLSVMMWKCNRLCIYDNKGAKGTQLLQLKDNGYHHIDRIQYSGNLTVS